jgi:chromosome segregation ATPase
MMSFLNDLSLEAEAMLNAPVSQKDNDILNRRVMELEEKTRGLEKKLNQQQLEAATRESELQAQVDKPSRDVDDAREEFVRQNYTWKEAKRKLKASLDASEKEQASLIRTRASLTTKVHQLRREKIFLVENLKTQSREAKEAKKEAETLRDDFDALNYDVF